MDSDLVLVIFGARYPSASRSCGILTIMLMSMSVDFDRSRYTSVRS